MILNLGNQIRMNRRRMDLTQEQLAEKFGTSPQAISRWETGATYPDIEMLPMIASFFGMSVDALLGCTDEEKEKFCTDLQKSLTKATKEKDIDKTIELLRIIRRNLREYQQYWFWGIYHDFWDSRLFNEERVLDEMRLLAEEIFIVCPREKHFAIIENMAYMENEENINAFLNAYAAREDMSRSRLLFNRYKMREELDKIEPIRQFNLWYELEHIVTAANDWQEYLCKDYTHYKWFCETQLNYLNMVNCLTPDNKHVVSGSDELDLWCVPRVLLGLRYTSALSRIGEIEFALDVFENTVSIIENATSISDEKFELGCNSPALRGFTLSAKFHWIEKDGKEYRELCLENSGWSAWISPIDILQSVMNDSWFGPIKIDDERFDLLLTRLEKCVVKRDAEK